MKTIRELINDINMSPQDSRIYFNSWLDDVQLRKLYITSPDFLEKEPEWKNIPKERRAFYAGVSHYLAKKCGLAIPEWTYNNQYFLQEPYFSRNAKGKLQLVLLAESPNEFRVRNIFISANSLDRV